MDNENKRARALICYQSSIDHTADCKRDEEVSIRER